MNKEDKGNFYEGGRNDSVEFVHKGHRGISKDTFELYGVLTKVVNGIDSSVAFPYYSGEKEALKIRDASIKRFQVTGEGFRDSGLFGQEVFDKASREAVLVTEGEFDAMAAYELLDKRFACVSLKSGASSAVRDFKNSYDYLNSFDKIYLCFDNDEQGYKAAKAVQGIFDFRKVYHISMKKFKDANEYLINHETEGFRSLVLNSRRFAPDNVIHSFDDIKGVLKEDKEDLLGEYPFPVLNQMLYGLHAGEVIVLKAQEGVGKTEFFRAMESHLIKTTPYNIGIIHLEEDNGTTVKAIAGYHLGVPAILPDSGLSLDEVYKGYTEAVNGNEDRVHIHSSFDIEDEEAFLGNIRFLSSVAGCRFIFLDHITWLATGMQDEDERRKLDRISQKLKLLSKELRFTLVMISHVNDYGQTRGSRNITKVANSVISLSRDVNEGSDEISISIEKARLSGRTGPAGFARFNREEGRLLPVSSSQDDSEYEEAEVSVEVQGSQGEQEEVTYNEW